MPSAIALVVLAQLTGSVDLSRAGWVDGLKIAAVAVVAQAVLSMERTLTPDWPRRGVAVAAAAVALAWTTPFSQVAIIAAGALVGRFLLARPAAEVTGPEPSPIGRRLGIAALIAFFAITFAAYLRAVTGSSPNGWAGAAIAPVAIFLPSFLLVFGTLPFWDLVRR